MTETDETETMVSLPLIGNLTFREWHHFVGGVYTGYRNENRPVPETQAAYWQGGWLLGHTIRQIT
jgi:hypothetical protein